MFIFTKNNKKGMTLVELIIAAGLFVLILGVVFYVWQEGRQMGEKSKEKGKATAEARRLLSLFTEDVRELKEIKTFYQKYPDNENPSKIILLEGTKVDNKEIKYEFLLAHPKGKRIVRTVDGKDVPVVTVGLNNVEMFAYDREPYPVVDHPPKPMTPLQGHNSYDYKKEILDEFINRLNKYKEVHEYDKKKSHSEPEDFSPNPPPVNFIDYCDKISEIAFIKCNFYIIIKSEKDKTTGSVKIDKEVCFPLMVWPRYLGQYPG